MTETKADIFVICAPEISNILHQEIISLGFKNSTVQRLGVQLFGTLKDCMLLNLHLRTANKVLWQVAKFNAANPDDLYAQANAVHWENEIGLTSYFNIDSYVKNDTITDSRFANLKLKDAIVDRFVEKAGKRPDSGPNKDQIRIYMHWADDECMLYYDTSGGVIAKHGYRKIPGKAPMLESLAAAVILTSNWDRQAPFINPMCGSGTLAIEAALLATNTAPGLFRTNFGFMHLSSFDATLWDDLKKKAKQEVVATQAIIHASDISAEAVNIAKINAKEAGMDKHIRFEQTDFRSVELPEVPGVIIFNPEYGERMGDVDELEAVYESIGDFFKQKCKGYTGYIFTGNRELAKKVGLKTKRKIEFWNGNIDCRLLEFEIYDGSRR